MSSMQAFILFLFVCCFFYTDFEIFLIKLKVLFANAMLVILLMWVSSSSDSF